MVPADASAAAAFLLDGFRNIGQTPVRASERGLYCMMGICFDYIAEIDGVPNRQACTVEARPGIRVYRTDSVAPRASGAKMTAELAIIGVGPAGIAAAAAAALSGRLAALDAAAQRGHIGEAERDSRTGPIRAARDRELALRPFLDRLYRPAASELTPAEDETIAFLCEEVSVDASRRPARRRWTKRAQGFHALRHGAVSGGAFAGPSSRQ